MDQVDEALQVAGQAARVTDREEIDKALDMFVAKYDFDLPSEEERERAILFRMDSP